MTGFQHKHASGDKGYDTPGKERKIHLTWNQFSKSWLERIRPSRSTKTIGPRILKIWQNQDLCVGKLAPVAKSETSKAPGKFSTVLSWRKGEQKVTEAEIIVKEVRIEDGKPMELIDDVEESQNGIQFSGGIREVGEEGPHCSWRKDGWLDEAWLM